MLIVRLACLKDADIDFSLLPQTLLDEANNLSGQRKKQFLVCRSILAHLLKQYCDISMLPVIKVGDNGRPSFLEPHLPDFNISHSQDWVAVAISLVGKVGLDIEVARPRKNYLKVAKNFFADDEYQWMTKQDDTLRAFWQLWTLKESALKLYAKGVWQIKSVNVDLKQQMIMAPFAQEFYYQYRQVDNVHLSVNSNQPISKLILLS
ncbi:MAG: 4'-phosphopantetheinyl transferase superfamily protein [Gilliamella sp.]|uniref:4'-phosphopantetheinyl transferase family protein n=1 Tax=Gilliamella sp. BG1 TaxID=3351508 RepID=UPI00398657A3|nr:4'-phosphopantetheinyl transferase superfamily protein [Gilliamella sp.]